ncbi:hypothetical protein TRFO_28531 [Tritrichomonas foetus]|uniref:Uncharacterized protein n=1 Tax=Tritrichomonas foetus TaxID=1144522 RepID=A0A1J4K2R2_9EUKA|nr:hypothetical protein TRFO_28531 [Tritrichomonas foetus]|eukprot:OHT04036.1 hypothetical protein TRFO_28531 [Tritrichomonas foetus]
MSENTVNTSMIKRIMGLSAQIVDDAPDFAINKVRNTLQMYKTLDLLNYMTDHFGPINFETELIFPFTAKFNGKEKVTKWVKKYISSPSEIYARCTQEFFEDENNAKMHKEFFVQCCFPSLFVQFLTDEYSEFAYNFLNNYLKLDLSDDNNNSINNGKRSYLKAEDLISSFILHNFEFRQELVEVLYRIINQDQRKELFLSFIEAFKNCLSYLNQYQIKILQNLIETSKEKMVNFLKIMIIQLITLWRFTPEFSANNLMWTYRKTSKKADEYAFEPHSKFEGVILTLRYEKYEDLFIDFFQAIKNSSYSNPIYIKNILYLNSDWICLSLYEVKLFHFIVDQIPANLRTMDLPLHANDDGARIEYNRNNALYFYFDSLDLIRENSSPSITIHLISRKFSKTENELLIEWARMKQEAKEKGVDQSSVGDREFAIMAMKAEKESLENVKNDVRQRVGFLTDLNIQRKAAKKVLYSVILRFSDAHFIVLKDKMGIDKYTQYYNKILVNQFMSQSFIREKSEKDQEEIRKRLELVNKIKPEERKSEYVNALHKVLKDNFDPTNLEERFDFLFMYFHLFEFGQFLTLMNRSSMNNKKKVKAKYVNPSEHLQDSKILEICTAMDTSITMMFRNFLNFNETRGNFFTGFCLMSLANISEYVFQLLEVLEFQYKPSLLLDILMYDKNATFQTYVRMGTFVSKSEKDYKILFPKRFYRILDVFDNFSNGGREKILDMM